MNQRIEHCLYQAGLTAQGCWDELDDYTKQGIEKFAQLIVRECMKVSNRSLSKYELPSDKIAEHFGVNYD
jgi:hypothetical protein